MLFWVIAAFLTLAASLAVLLPLSRGVASSGDASHDLEVYRDQLSEIERDMARGLIEPAEAEQAKTEIARRILRLDTGRMADAKPTDMGRTARLVATAAVLLVPLLSWGVYARLGSPDLPAQPLSARLTKDPADSSVDELVARAEAHLAANPSDGRGWDVLAPIYLRMGRFADSVTAYRNAIRLDGATAARQAGLGEALTNAAGGVVSAEAQGAFEAALKAEPAQPKANFYLAMALAQEGRNDDAGRILEKMLGTLPADSPWRNAAEEALAGSLNKSRPPSQPSTGPGQADVDAAASLSAEDRAAMIETMVAGLDEKLQQNPKDEEGWMKLMRSYVVLGKADQARDALKRAVAAFGTGSDEARKLTEFAGSLGLTATE